MKIWSKQLLIKPDPAPYLMASRSVRLLAAPGTSLLWPSTPQLLSDTLSKKTVGQNPFEFSFSVHSSSIGAGTVYLLEMPGLLNVKAEDGTLMFSFGWKSGWYAVPASVLVDGWKEVALSGDGVAEIKLTVNTSQFTIFGTGTSAEPYPTITTGQLDVKNNWLKLKDVNAILVGVAPDPEPPPEPDPDTPKKWYPSTGTGNSVWTPDDVVKPNDPVYDTESNETTNNGSTGKVDTVVSVRPDGSGFTGSSGTDYTDTYTPPAPVEYNGAVACISGTKLVDGGGYNSATYPPEPQNNYEFGYTKVTVNGNNKDDYTFTDNIVYSDSKCTNRFGTIISHTENATLVRYDETWSFTQPDGTVLTGEYVVGVSVTGSCLNEAPVNNTLGLLNVFDGVVSTYKIKKAPTSIPDDLKGELYVSLTDTGYSLTTKVHTFFKSGEFPISYALPYYHDPLSEGETAYELVSTTGDYFNDAYVVVDGKRYRLTFIGNKLATQY